jgi:hypothetical protein
MATKRFFLAASWTSPLQRVEADPRTSSAALATTSSSIAVPSGVAAIVRNFAADSRD